MFVDASAMIAILILEDDAAALARRLEQAAEPRTSPIAICEALLGIARVSNISVDVAAPIIDRFLQEVG